MLKSKDSLNRIEEIIQVEVTKEEQHKLIALLAMIDKNRRKSALLKISRVLFVLAGIIFLVKFGMDNFNTEIIVSAFLMVTAYMGAAYASKAAFLHISQILVALTGMFVGSALMVEGVNTLGISLIPAQAYAGVFLLSGSIMEILDDMASSCDKISTQYTKEVASIIESLQSRKETRDK